MVDGEVMERLWSYLRLFRKMTKEMTTSHREDILSDALYFYAKKQRSKIVMLLNAQMQRCTELLSHSTSEIEELRENSPVLITEEMINQWKEQESDLLRKSKPDHVDLGAHGWILPYFSVLRQYYSARNQLADGTGDQQSSHLEVLMSSLNSRLIKMEEEHDIKTRWSQTDQQYISSLTAQECVNAKQTLDMLLVSGRRRWFLLSLKKKYAEGQRQAKRLANSITKESSNLRRLMKRYNSSVEILRQNGRQMFVDLTWEKASDVTSSIYTINFPNQDEILLSVKRTAVDIVNLINRLLEEGSYLRHEMESCIKTFYDACLEIENKSSGFVGMGDDTEESNELKGLNSLKKNELHEEQINLFVSSNLFKQFIKIPDEVVEYLQQHSELSEENENGDEVYDEEEENEENEDV
ncbi:Hypothetical predicted protein [Paramuricea clavata]|uniref:Uncharacterized protein n=1 Tax=Paramuricea clavata TaxID=317549 RepID=A0A6S7L173_PARCT|nr:Hypothetical predicted protein [Paramuricea clavata]